MLISISRGRRRILPFVLASAVAWPALSNAADGNIVLYSSDVVTIRGNWSVTSNSAAAGGQLLQSIDAGWSAVSAALPSPADYFEASITAPAGVPYHVWLRLRATADSKYNDSVWVQFSDAVDPVSNRLYPIASSSGLLVNLEPCNSCGVVGWGWQDRGYWQQPAAVVQFASSGSHTIRVQTREDGVQIDQIVLSPSAYLNAAPGAVTNDATIVPKPPATPVPPAPGASPYSGTPAAIPGTIQAEEFDIGGDGIAYHDLTLGNTGGAFRQTDVDIEPVAGGGFNIGWIAAGEWTQYTVNVASAGNYTAQFIVASSGGGGTFHLEANGADVSGALTIPNTGGWQNWQAVSRPVSLAAGRQSIRLVFDTLGSSGAVGNVDAIRFTVPVPVSPPLSTPFGGSPLKLPGRVEAENFDNGSEGAAYHDTTSGNAGGAYRATDVDIEACGEGGYNVGWAAAGEWLNYTVDVAKAGAYVVQVRVASPTGASIHVGFAGNVWAGISVPATGSWQAWTTVSVPVTLVAGVQPLRLQFDTAGVNANFVDVVAQTAPPTPGGTSVSALTWNIQIDDSSDAHARLAMDLAMAVAPQPQILVIQEAHAAQFNAYLDELQKQTGKVWHGVLATHCGLGAWTGTTCSLPYDQGVALFTVFDIVNSDSRYFPFADCWQSARVGLRAALNVNGTILQAFTTHLQHDDGCANDAQSRYQSMAMLKSWAAGYPAPQIAAGDFNAGPDQIDTSNGMYPNFLDVWSLVGSGPGLSAYLPLPTLRIDYWFTDASRKASPQSMDVIQTTSTFSDHAALRATFIVP